MHKTEAKGPEVQSQLHVLSLRLAWATLFKQNNGKTQELELLLNGRAFVLCVGKPVS